MRRNNRALVQSHVQLRIHEREALYDPLTSLHNRRWIERKLDGIVDHCAQAGEDLALLMIDTDNFKRFNDEYGHPAGDQLLAAIARVIEGSIRAGDYACRYGGDEFMVVLPHTGEPEAARIAQRMCHAIREKIPHSDNAWSAAEISASIGMASLQPGMQLKQLLGIADAALYRAKAFGRDCVSS
jgi:diguanylate cyclase (GGDEF)-like protein